MEQALQTWLFDPFVGRLLSAAIGVVVVVVLVRIGQKSAGRYIASVEARYRTRKLIGMVGYVAAFLVVAMTFSDRLGGLTVALGVAGAGVAFALQEVIASVAGWLAVSWGGFYQAGDRVQLGGIKGDVIDIGVLRTTLMEIGQWVDGDLYNGRVVRVANSFVFKEPVFNYSTDFPFLWDEIRVPIKYGSDWRFAREMVQRLTEEVIGDYPDQAAKSWARMLRQYRLEDAAVTPLVTMVANDNWIEFTARYVVDFKRRRITKDRLFARLLEEIDANNDRVGLASATFQVVEIPPVDVRLRSSVESS